MESEFCEPKGGAAAKLRAGAEKFRVEILCFLHADTIPAAEIVGQMKNALKDGETVGGNFTIRFDGDSAAARFLTYHYPLLRKIGLVYCYSAIFVRRDAYQKTGGFKSIMLFEDLALANRLKRKGNLVNLLSTVTTSSRRFENRSFWLTFARWSVFQRLYWLGINPNFLAKIYYQIRATSKKISFLKRSAYRNKDFLLISSHLAVSGAIVLKSSISKNSRYKTSRSAGVSTSYQPGICRG